MIVCINYTSGTTGFSKGVITANNFANIIYADKLDLLFRGERTLAFLPMAHVYGCAFDFNALCWSSYYTTWNCPYTTKSY